MESFGKIGHPVVEQESPSAMPETVELSVGMEGAVKDRVGFDGMMAASSLVPLPPRFTFGACPEVVTTTYFSARSIPPQGVWRIRDVRVRGAFLLSIDERLLWSPSTNTYPAHVAQEWQRRDLARQSRPPRELAGDYVLFAGPGYRIYGHWLVDLLPKLYLLAASGLDVARCKFLMPADLPRFGRALLNAVGIDDSQLVHYDPSHDELLVEQLLVPTITHNSVRFSELYEKAVRFLVDRIRHGIGPLNPVERPTRLFVSRGTSKQRLCVNREQIESMAGAAGFTILRPELLPFAEQVQQFAAARCILGEYGSGLHGSIFSRPGTVVCGLKEASHNRLSFLQSGIGEALGQPTGYVYGEPITGGAAGSFSISPDAFSACLRLVFGSTPLMSPSYSGTAGRP